MCFSSVFTSFIHFVIKIKSLQRCLKATELKSYKRSSLNPRMNQSIQNFRVLWLFNLILNICFLQSERWRLISYIFSPNCDQGLFMYFSFSLILYWSISCDKYWTVSTQHQLRSKRRYRLPSTASWFISHFLATREFKVLHIRHWKNPEGGQRENTLKEDHKKSIQGDAWRKKMTAAKTESKVKRWRY